MSATFGHTELESIEYDLETQTYLARFDRATTAASIAVVAALSDVMDVDPMEIEPLGSVIDTDALDALIDHRGAADGDVSMTFTVDWYELTVSTEGVVTVTELDRSEPSVGEN